MFESYAEPVPELPEYMLLYGVALVPGFGAVTPWLSGWKASMTCCPGQAEPGMVSSWVLICHVACENRWSRLDMNLPSEPFCAPTVVPVSPHHLLNSCVPL